VPDIFVSPSTTTKVPPSTEGKTSAMSQALSAFLLRPVGMRFETQEANEIIVLLLRRHFITNVSWLLVSIILILIPPFVLTAAFLSPSVINQIPSTLIQFIILTWYLGIFSYILVNFLLWYFNVSIVTNQRIIDIDFINILYKQFSATRISKVEDVTTRRGGFIRTIFDYGDVFVQTAAQMAEFEFLAVPHPEQVVRIVNNLMGKV